jgi:chitodextrinase
VYKDGALLGSTTTATTYAVTGLTASTAYAFTVKAKDAAGNISAVSNTANVTTSAAPDTTAPTAPTSLAASNTTQTTTDLSWTASTDNVAVTGYDVYKDGALLGSTTTATTYAVTGLTASTAYAFTVKAKDAAGNISTVSNTANVTTLANSTNATDLLFSKLLTIQELR